MQDCGNNQWLNWTEIPKDGSKPRYPAPSVTVMKNGTLIQAADLASAQASKSSAGMVKISLVTGLFALAVAVLV